MQAEALPLFSPPTPVEAPMVLRPYQHEAVAETLRLWGQGTHRVLLVLATGLGKTVVATEVLRERRRVGRSLFIAHRTELLTQAGKKLRDAGLTVEVEQADQRARAVTLAPSDVVVGSVQTLRGARLQRWPRDTFRTIVVDEAHHAVAKSYRDILRHFSKANVLGLTATPDRSDEVGLAAVFQEVSANYGIREGIRDGWLVPIVPESLGNVDLSGVRTVAGDLNQGQLDAEVASAPVLYGIAGALADRTANRPTLVFTPGVESAHRLAEILAQLEGVGADAVGSIDGKTDRDRRAELLARFAAGDLRFLVNCLVLTEGFDAPRTSCVAIARPTKSRSLYAQMLGRGTRPLKGVVDGPPTAAERRAAIASSAKPDVLLLDLTDRDRIDLVGPADVLAGDEPLPDETRRAIREATEGNASQRSLEEIIAEAEAQGEALERRRAREARRAKIKVFAKYCSAPLVLEGLSDAHTELFDEAVRIARSTKGPRSIPATDKQRALLERHGITLPKTANVKQASKAIDAVVKRGLCSIRQARVLSRAGLRTDLTKNEASQAIDALASAGWQVTPEVLRQWGAE